MKVNANLIEENVIQIKSGITIIVDASVKKHFECKKGYIGNPVTCSCKNRKHLVGIIDDLVGTCNKHIEETVPSNFNEKKVAFHRISIFYWPFLLITIAL